MFKTHIVLHHSVTPRDLDNNKTESSFERTHKGRSFPKSKLGWHIGYHYVIFGDGEVRKYRHDDEMGAHCYQNDMNRKSIGICMAGNFDVEVPSLQQETSLRNLISKLMKYGIKELNYHRDFAPKSCPGTKISKDYITKILKLETMTKRELIEALYRQLNQKPTEDEIQIHMTAPNWDILLGGFFQAKEDQLDKKLAFEMGKIKTWVEQGKKLLDKFEE